MRRSTYWTASTIALVTLATTAASANVVFDNGVPAATDLPPAYPLTQSVQAEDFTLPEPSVVTALRFHAIERHDGYAGSIYWSIRNDESGQPSANEIAGDTTAAVVRTPTGVIRPDYFNAAESIYSIDVEPLILAAGDYWLLLHNGPLDYDRADTSAGFLQWEGTIGQRGEVGVQDPTPFEGVWEQTIGERSFSLVGVPEPGAKLTLGVAAVVMVRRTRALKRGAAPQPAA